MYSILNSTDWHVILLNDITHGQSSFVKMQLDADMTPHDIIMSLNMTYVTFDLDPMTFDLDPFWPLPRATTLPLRL